MVIFNRIIQFKPFKIIKISDIPSGDIFEGETTKDASAYVAVGSLEEALFFDKIFSDLDFTPEERKEMILERLAVVRETLDKLEKEL